MGNNVCPTGEMVENFDTGDQNARSETRAWRETKPSCSSSEAQRTSATAIQEGFSFLLIESCTNVPSSSSSSLLCDCRSPDIRCQPQVRAWASTVEGKLIGHEAEWPSRVNTRSPKWFSARPLGAPRLLGAQDAVLHMELRDGVQVVGRLQAPFVDLVSLRVITMAFNMLGSDCPPASVTFKVLDSWSFRMGFRTVYFVRHGESVWNAAQNKAKFHEMAAEFDHPLSSVGASQAERLRQRIAKGIAASSGADTAAVELSNPDVLYVSPLCRAIQTALIAFGPSQVKMNQEMVLMASARENQNFGGLDSMSRMRGAQIVRHAGESLKRVYPKQEDEHKLDNALSVWKQQAFDVQDAQEQWWCLGPMDTAKQIQTRVQDFMAQIMYAPHKTSIVVGHSHFFRSVFKACICEEFAERNSSLAEGITSKKLSNCGVARVTLDPTRGTDGRPIVAVQLVLDTLLEEDGRRTNIFCCSEPCHADGADENWPGQLSDPFPAERQTT